MTDDPGRPIARRDEVLELLYWLEGEKLGDKATLDGLTRFLTYPADEVRATLDDLVRRGDVVPSPRPGQAAVEYRLTETGRREGGQRFTEEFAPLLGRGHGECSDPDCDCHTTRDAAAACTAARAYGRHAH